MLSGSEFHTHHHCGVYTTDKIQDSSRLGILHKLRFCTVLSQDSFAGVQVLLSHSLALSLQSSLPVVNIARYECGI